MRVLLIGGSGFIGSPLATELRSHGHEIAVFHRGTGATASRPGERHLLGDRNRLSLHRDGLREFAPEAIVDLILASGEQARELTEVARALTSRLVVLSSADVYRAWGIVQGIEPGRLEPLPIAEDAALRSFPNVYSDKQLETMRAVFSWLPESYDKIAVEREVMNSGVPATVLRLPMVYGPGDPLHRCFPVVKRIADARPAMILSDDLAAWRLPRGYVQNVAHAIGLAVTSERAAGRIYNVCEEPCLTELEWQTRIANEAGWQGRFVVLRAEETPGHLLPPGNTRQHLVLSSERIRSELGYRELVPAGEALRRTIDWERRNPPDSMDEKQFDYALEDQSLRHAR